MKNLITIFVPTYNRELYLPKLLDSLKHQDFKYFELLIVDDGSSDNTKELINKWIEYNFFKIRYIYQKNAGKHIAYNLGIKETNTELFLELDSDDYLKINALSTITTVWKNIENKHDFAGIQCLCCNENGNIIGDKFNKTISNNYEIRTLNKIKGDKGMIYQTKKLKQYSLPVINEIVPESILHNRVSRGLKTYCLNEPLFVKQYLEDGLTKKLTRKKTRYKSFIIKYNELNYFNPPFHRYIYYNGKYVKFSLLEGKSITEIYKEAINKKLYFVIAFIYGFLTYFIKKLKINKH